MTDDQVQDLKDFMATTIRNEVNYAVDTEVRTVVKEEVRTIVQDELAPVRQELADLTRSVGEALSISTDVLQEEIDAHDVRITRLEAAA